MILPKNIFFLNIKIKLNSRTWMTLKSSAVIFRTLEPQQPQWPLQPQRPRWPQWPLQPHSIKKILILMVGSSLVPKWPIQVPFCRMYHQKSKFSLILAPFLSEAAEASQCYFFENWLMKLKCPILLKPLDTMIQENYWSFYPSEPFRITRFTMRHPVIETC